MKRMQPVAVFGSALVATALWWSDPADTGPAPHPTATQIDAAVLHARVSAGLEEKGSGTRKQPPTR